MSYVVLRSLTFSSDGLDYLKAIAVLLRGGLWKH